MYITTELHIIIVRELLPSLVCANNLSVNRASVLKDFAGRDERDEVDACGKYSN